MISPPFNSAAHLTIGDETGVVKIWVEEVVSPETPQIEGDFKISVQVKSEEFNGRVSDVWISSTEFETFLEQLGDLDRTRQGSAQIEGGSPDEFVIRIFSSDKLGHMRAEGKITHITTSRPDDLFSCVGFSFEVDPSRLSSLIVDFQRLRTIE